MPQYRLNCFEGSSLIRTDKFFAPSDEAAIAGAVTRNDGAAAELWTGNRKVKTFERRE